MLVFLSSPRIWSLPWCFNTPRAELEHKSQFPLYGTFSGAALEGDGNQLCPPLFPCPSHQRLGRHLQGGVILSGVESLLAESSPWNGWTLNIWNYSSLQELKCKNAAEVQDCQTGNLMEMLGWAGCTQHSSCKWSGKFSCKQQDFPSFFERPFDRLILSNQSFTVSKLK